MAKKSHLKIKNDEQRESVSTFKYNYGFAETEASERNPRFNNRELAIRFAPYIRNYSRDIAEKYENRDREIEIPISIDYVRFDFIDQFNILKYNPLYYSELGLEGVEFTNFGKTGLFAVIDKDKFNAFFSTLQRFALRPRRFDIFPNRPRFISYIKSFALLTYKDILNYDIEKENDIFLLSLADLPADDNMKTTLVEALVKYLEEKSIEFLYDEETDRIELHNVPDDEVVKIIQNFDIVLSVTSSFYRTVSPSEYNTVKLEEGFTISNADDNLPIIAILDTGISEETPLRDILIDDDRFTLVGNPFEDKTGHDRNGHGTAVAALAALGKQNHINAFSADVKADAKLLSVKILDKNSGSISETKLLDTLYEIKDEYPDLKFFVLTTCYDTPKKTNENYSDYTLALDKFAFETDSLIFICTANSYECFDGSTDYDYTLFGRESTNLCSPADSMNNMVVGAASDNFFDTCPESVSPGKEFPTLYSRTGHLDQPALMSPTKVNKNLFKPDVIESGGDLGFNRLNEIDAIDAPALKLLSANPTNGSYYEVGTSFSTPLVANIAARIQKEYPNINTQSVKALIINGASLDNIKFPEDHKALLKNACGNGVAQSDIAIFSNENNATFILEDSIKDEEIKIYPINIPDYITRENMGKNRGVLKITATLCFSFLPIRNNQLVYCPIHIGYSFFKDQTADQIQLTNNELKSFFKSSLGWSQNGRHVAKPIPYSNSQKIEFVVNCDELQNENFKIKLALHCKISKQIVGGLPDSYANEFPFSLVFRIEETIKENTDQLYDGLVALNKVEILNQIDLEGDLEAE